MSALWSTLGSTFSAVSSFDGAFCFLFVLITCWSLIFPMLHKKRWLKKTSRSSAVVCMKLYLLNLSFCTLQTSPSRLTIFFQSCNRLTPSCTWRKHYYMWQLPLTCCIDMGSTECLTSRTSEGCTPCLTWMTGQDATKQWVYCTVRVNYAKVYGTFQLPFYFHNTTYSR